MLTSFKKTELHTVQTVSGNIVFVNTTTLKILQKLKQVMYIIAYAGEEPQINEKIA